MRFRTSHFSSVNEAKPYEMRFPKFRWAFAPLLGPQPVAEQRTTQAHESQNARFRNWLRGKADGIEQRPVRLPNGKTRELQSHIGAGKAGQVGTEHGTRRLVPQGNQ